jgi:superfamily II DNA helicase RecQ
MLYCLSKIQWDDADGRGMIFVRTKSECDDYADAIGEKLATTYYGEGIDVEESLRQSPRNMASWKRGDFRWIVCTCGASLGIDYAFVRYVYIVDLKGNVKEELDLVVQEFGRGGRDGLPCDCVLFTVPPTAAKRNDLGVTFVDQVCIRSQLDGCLVTSPSCFTLDENHAKCSVCLSLLDNDDDDKIDHQSIYFNPSLSIENAKQRSKDSNLADTMQELTAAAIQVFLMVIIIY